MKIDTGEADITTVFNEAVHAHNSGDLSRAEQLYKETLSLQPDHSEANHNIGAILTSKNELEDALKFFKFALDTSPNVSLFWASYIDVLIKLDRITESKNLIKALTDAGISCDKIKAISHKLDVLHQEPGPKILQHLENLKALTRSCSTATEDPSPEQLKYLENFYIHESKQNLLILTDQLLSRFPKSSVLYNITGIINADLEQYQDAIENYQSAIKIKPDYADAYNNMANAFKNQSRLNDAVSAYEKALYIDPNYAQVYYNLGNALASQGKLDQSITAFKNAISIKPDYVDAYNNMGTALKDQYKLKEALRAYNKALSLDPNSAEIHNNIGSIFDDQSNLDESITAYNKAIAIKPDYADAYFNRGNILKKIGDFEAAKESYKQAITIKPDLIGAHVNLALQISDEGDMKTAIEIYSKICHGNPGHPSATSNLIHAMAQSEFISNDDFFSKVCSYAEKMEAPFRIKSPNHSNSRDLNRHLQIGFVSGDFREHSAAFFLLPLLASLKTYPDLTLHAYYTHNINDAITKDFEKIFNLWNRVKHISDQQLADKIIEDKIDILIDLSNHTAFNRLPVFARKPAPVQITAIGTGETTGLTSMDYNFGPTDRFLEKHYTECCVRLPSYCPYKPFSDMPAVNKLPALDNNFITFGSFNRVPRINRSTIALWSRLLRKIPSAKFLFGGQSNETIQNKFKKWFNDEEIELSRVTFLPTMSFNDYCYLHHKIDVHLVSFPYSGGTTISNALWMGVPSLGLTNFEGASGGGNEIYNRIGLKGFLLDNEDNFINKGLYLAKNLTELAEVRKTLREKFSTSEFCDSNAAAAYWETALRRIWRRWCSGLAPEPFTLAKNDSK